MTSKIGDASVVLDLPPHYRKRDLLLLRELLEAGKYRPVIDRRYPLEDVVEATKYVETGQKTGNVVLTVSLKRSKGGTQMHHFDARSGGRSALFAGLSRSSVIPRR